MESSQSPSFSSAAEPPGFKQCYDPRKQAHVGLRGIFVLLWEDVIGTAGEKCKAGQFTSETGKKLTMKMVSPWNKGAEDFLPFEASQVSTDGLTLRHLPSLTGY